MDGIGARFGGLVEHPRGPQGNEVVLVDIRGSDNNWQESQGKKIAVSSWVPSPPKGVEFGMGGMHDYRIVSPFIYRV